MPDSFETDLASCFDEQYKKSVSELEQFVATYRAALNAIHSILTENSKNLFASDLLQEYKTKVDLFMERAQNNVTLLKQKTDDPATSITLPGLTDILRQLNAVSEQINAEIKECNAIIDARGKSSSIASTSGQFMAFICQSESRSKSGKNGTR